MKERIFMRGKREARGAVCFFQTEKKQNAERLKNSLPSCEVFRVGGGRGRLNPMEIDDLHLCHLP